MLSASPPPAPAAALIGRATEVEDVLDLLGRARLVTLTGPPGVGKTRLALAVCADRDDVSWVDLAPIRDPLQVRAELTRAARPEGDDHATDRLVVLDNCEHLLDSDLAGQLADLLRSTARLQVLATSRERLRLAAEREYAVPPLPMPSADDADDLARLRGNPAVALLLDRAPPAVQLTPNTARALVEICVDLDGLPLAIELAAARLRVFTPSELAFRLGRRMSVLTSGPRDAPDRHRDLRAAIAWSHDLLSDRDSAAFRRLSVFPGEWDLESAAAVCAEPDVLDVVESLLDKSLVRRAGEDLDGNARFTMLMSLREYAAEQLAEQAEEQTTRDRHATWFTRRAREWEATVGTTAETDTWPQLAAFHADLDAALAACPRRGRRRADRLAGRGAGLVRLHPWRPGRGRGAAGRARRRRRRRRSRSRGPGGGPAGGRGHGVRPRPTRRRRGTARPVPRRRRCARGAPGRRGARLPRPPRPGAR